MRSATIATVALAGLAGVSSAYPTKRLETPLNKFLAYLLNDVPFLNVLVNDVASAFTGLYEDLDDVTGANMTENQFFDDPSACKDFTLVFARGTSEPGNVGVLLGPPLMWALQEVVGVDGLTVQGVNNYSATVDGYFEGGDPVGSTSMANTITQVRSSCPDTKLIATGYSQGSQVTHNALSKLDAETAEWVHKVLVFGDPDDGEPIPNIDESKVRTFCNTLDDICQDGDIIGWYHIIYAENATTAAQWATS